jgi:hypothetical protein
MNLAISAGYCHSRESGNPVFQGFDGFPLFLARDKPGPPPSRG